MNNTISKMLACMLVITLTFTNLILLGTYATNSYAAGDELEQQETLIKGKVEFDAYFLDSEDVERGKVHTKTVDVNEQNLTIHVSLKVLEGYLKDAFINMQNASFVLEDVSDKYDEIQKIENNIITLNQISKGEEIIFEIPIKIDRADVIDVNNFFKENEVKITGTLVTGETGITGKEKNEKIEGTILVKTNICGTATPILYKGGTAYTEYTAEGQSGVILQTVIQTGLENNNLPIEKTILELDVPLINAAKPSKINVRADSLIATRADENGKSFEKGNYKYYADEGKVRITVGNSTNEKEEASWAKTGLDKYIITYMYEGQTIGDITEMTLKANLAITTYAYNEEDETKPQIVTVADERTTTLERTQGNIANFEVEATDSISKGYMYHKPELEVEYQTKWIANLEYVDIIDNAEMRTEADVITNGDNSIAISGGTYYKSTIISKENFTKILGIEEDAYIEIWNSSTSSNDPIVKIDKDTQVNEENNIVINYDAGIDNIFIRTSKPVNEGSLEILHNKALKSESFYSKYGIEELRTLSKVVTKLNGAAVNDWTEIDGGLDLQKEISLEDSKTKIDATIDTTNLSTVVTNENINLKVVLKNNDISTDLYKNPMIEVLLPSYVEEAKINKVGLLYEDENSELVMEEPIPYQTESGILGLKVQLTGEQTQYHTNQSTEGVTLLINADITAKKLTPSITEKIQIYVTNEKAITYENENNGRAYKELDVNFVAPIGMVTLNSISGYNGEEKVTSLSGQESLGEIPINSSAKNAKVSLSVINNYEATCENINILGRLPVAGNKNIDGTDLGSNVTLNLVNGIVPVSGIPAENVVVYYSDNIEATNDLTNSENRWTTNMENAKSYLIVLNNYQMPKGSVVEFAYDVQVPANLQHNQTAYTIYTVYFNKDSGVQESNTSAKVGLSTMAGPELTVNFKANVENGQEVQEGQRIVYNIEVKNTGDIEAHNMKVVSAVPEGTTYVEYIPANTDGYGPERYEEHPEIKAFETTIENIKPGETKTVQYIAQINSIENTERTLYANATLTLVGTSDVYQTSTIENKVKKGSIVIEQSCTEQEVIEGQTIIYDIVIRNSNNEPKTNVIITNQIPNGIKYVEAEAFREYNNDSKNISYNEENKTITYNISELKSNEQIEMSIMVEIDKLGENDIEKEFVNIIKATSDQTNQEILSNEVKLTVKKPKLEIKQESNVAPGNISVGDKITYNIEVKNVGTGPAYDVVVTDYIPEGLKYINSEYIIGDYSSKSSIGRDTAEIYADIEAGQTLYIKVNVIAKELGAGEKQKEVTNIVKVSGSNINEIEANAVTHIINPKGQSQDGEEGSNDKEDYNYTYKITGTVWQDGNENGKREDSENVLEGINVILVNAKTAEKVTETLTNAQGKYEFLDLESGRYMVIFMYNEQEYVITTYQAEGIDESRNSDAIHNKITVDGQTVESAITSNINLTSANRYNIDLGLVLRNKFDLSLTKTINKITVTTTKGTENYTYEEGKQLAKVDIAPKRIEGANVVIEYKISVQNNGNIPGFVSKVVDYLPKELKFSSELNPEWYEGEDGNLYSVGLSALPLEPGETQEIILVLTKTMTGENTGLIHNTAEIAEAYNDLGIVDINSQAGNNTQNENDISSADVLLTVNTGEPVMYITLTIAMLALFAVGAYFINKKVLRK